MHDAVEELDFQNKVTYVRPANVDYYTQAILDASIRIKHGGTENTETTRSRPLAQYWESRRCAIVPI